MFRLNNYTFSISTYIFNENECYINADCGGGFFKVLTENERIIKSIIE